MNLSKKFIRSISQMTKPSMCLYLNSREREREIYKRSPQLGETLQNGKDLFSAMIKYLCWGIQVKLLFMFWFNDWFEQWQCWEAQMLALLKPALMPIQGSVWSCVKLQEDQSTEEWTVSTSDPQNRVSELDHGCWARRRSRRGSEITGRVLKHLLHVNDRLLLQRAWDHKYKT